MSTTMIALILLVCLTSIVGALIYIHNKNHKKEKDRLLHQFSLLGTAYDLSFTSQEIFSHGVIGLDGIHKKLLYLEAKDQWPHEVIDLSQVKSCSLKKNYISHPVTNDHSRMDVQVQDISLAFSFKNGRDPVHVIFYSHVFHNIYLQAELEVKAKEWQIMLSKLLNNIQEQRA